MKKQIFMLLVSAATIANFPLGVIGSSNHRVLSGCETIIILNELLGKNDTVAPKVVYTCPMHQNVQQDKSGKCPKCKMNLVQKVITGLNYICPMHSDVIQNKPGKCPKCGMNLVEKTTSKK